MIAIMTMIVSAFSFGHVITKTLKDETIENTLYLTKNMVAHEVFNHFRKDDLTEPKTGDEAYDKFTQKVKQFSEDQGIYKIKIWNGDKVIWSHNKKLVGQRFPADRKLREALSGRLVADTHEDIRGEHFNHLLELYVPVEFEPQKISGIVLEIYKDIDPIYAAIDRHTRTVWLHTVLFFTLATSIFLAIVWNASKRLAAQTKEISRTKKDWEDTFNTITDIITVHDRDHNIIRANKAAQNILAMPDLEMNRRLEHHHGTDSFSEKHFRDAQKFNDLEIFEPQLNRFFEIRAIPRLDELGRFAGLIHIVRDISERKRAEGLIQLQINRLDSLHSFEKGVNYFLNLDDILDHLVNEFTIELEIDAAAVLLMDQQAKTLEYRISRGFRSDALSRATLDPEHSNAGRAVTERHIISVHNLAHDPEGFARCIQLEKEEFISYFAVPLIAKGKIKGVLELFHRSPLTPDPEWMSFLDTIADQAASAIEKTELFEELKRSRNEIILAYDNTIMGWSYALDMRDRETEGHSRRVMEMTLQIAKALGISGEDLAHIKRGALLHDIGKIAVPDSILLKPGPLTDGEWEIMRRHPEHAYNMLCKIDYLKPALVIPYFHHEKWDGTGYPRGLRGEEIPLPARIFAIVDVWDALTSDRPYRSAWPREKVINYISTLAGAHFDPELVNIFMKVESSFGEQLLLMIKSGKYPSEMPVSISAL
jgi:HD-GYP domain-containing protein (c-di-GMP phosphodiesterase class II)/PAS domain-containing protein